MIKINREHTCCFTGHRDIPSFQYQALKQSLATTIRGLIDRDITCFAAGGALGFDTMAAQVVLDLRATMPRLRLNLVLPCQSQTRGWSEENQLIYEKIKAQANEVTYTAMEYTRGCMFKRNRHLVDQSGICVCYMTRARSGTAYTVNYARRQGLEIINLAECLEVQ